MKIYGMVRVGLAISAALVLGSSPALAAVVSQQFFLSETNKLYYAVVANSSSGSFAAQITSVMLTSGTAVPVTETSNNPPDPVVTSFGTFLTGGILRFPPLSNIKRTAIISGLPSNNIEDMGNPLNGDFDPTGDGLLTLPGGARTVRFDGTGTEPVVDITQTTGAGLDLVPAATTATITRRIGMTTFANSTTIVFPNPPGAVVTSHGATCVGGGNPDAPCDPFNGNADCTGGGTCTDFGGEVAGQNVTLDDTLGSRVGNPASQGANIDGFYLPSDTTMIVFLVDDGAAAFGLTADGFAVTGTCSNADTPCSIDEDCVGGTCGDGLSRRNVINTTGDVDNNQFLPTPTLTPSNTATVTATFTATNTATQTNTPTDTNTPTATFTATATRTDTATFTETPTRTATATNTATRPPIPVVPSPFSTSGLIMISALGAGMIWALRRLFVVR
jgi:hypothetical protein